MTKVTWLGGDGPETSIEWRGLHFAKGKAVDVDDEATIEKAKVNRFFKVDDGKAAVPSVSAQEEHRAAQHAKVSSGSGASHGKGKR